MDDFLFIIPARGGSKGIVGKNIKKLNGIPLIYYSIDFARKFTVDENICLTTDSTEIVEFANKIDLKVPFIRPHSLALDNSGTFDVLKHAVDFYIKLNKIYKGIILLQPTSPFRKVNHLNNALSLFEKKLDMVVSVNQSKGNPYYNLFEENDKGFLELSKKYGNFVRRQDIPDVYEFNGSIYIINWTSIVNFSSFRDFKYIKKFIMDEKYSIDLDNPLDWEFADFLLKKGWYD